MTSARQTPDNSVIYVRHMVITRTSKLVEAPPDCPSTPARFYPSRVAVIRTVSKFMTNEPP